MGPIALNLNACTVTGSCPVGGLEKRVTLGVVELVFESVELQIESIDLVCDVGDAVLTRVKVVALLLRRLALLGADALNLACNSIDSFIPIVNLILALRFVDLQFINHGLVHPRRLLIIFECNNLFVGVRSRLPFLLLDLPHLRRANPNLMFLR